MEDRRKSDDVQRTLGEISGKLDSLITGLKDHAAEDTRRFEAMGKLLMQHSDDISQAKGAKAAFLITGSIVSAAVAGCATAIDRFLLK